jgi:hypothetical protein
MTFEFLDKFEKLLHAKLVSLAVKKGNDNRTWLYSDEVQRTFGWCDSQGIIYSSHLHGCLQVFDADKQIIASVRTLGDAMGTRRWDFYFIVPLDLAEKALLLGALPE